MRSEVIGSLLRPPYLAEARRRHEAGEISAAEFKRLEDRAVDEAIDTRTPHRAKVTLISAQQAAAYYDPEKSRDAYPTRDAYLADIVDITRREIEELRRLGCTYVQIDAPQYAALLDHDLREGYRRRGSD